jgi:hypothetical protein
MTRDKEILEVQMEHKVKIVEVLKKHKIYPKAKVQMNIPFCRMISMPVVKLALKINVFKMEHGSKWVIKKATMLFVFHTN